MHSQVYWHQGIGNNSRTFLIFFALSSICHVVFFGIVIFAPDFKTEKMSTLSVINVSMVTLPAQEKRPAPVRQVAVQTQKKLQTSKILPKNASETYQEPSKAVSVAPKRKIKKSLKKETFKSSAMVKRAIERLEKKVEEARPDQITQALDRLKDKVQKTGELDKQKHKPLQGKGSAMPVAVEPGGKRVLELLDIYRIEVAYYIQKNWAFSEQLAGGRTDLVAELAFTIMPSGEIKDIWFDKRSGNRYLDESAKKAVLKSNPVRPHPPGVTKPFVIVGLRFTPMGVK
jgi:colicin import membrane protein